MEELRHYQEWVQPRAAALGTAVQKSTDYLSAKERRELLIALAPMDKIAAEIRDYKPVPEEARKLHQTLLDLSAALLDVRDWAVRLDAKCGDRTIPDDLNSDEVAEVNAIASERTSWSQRCLSAAAAFQHEGRALFSQGSAR